MNNLSTLRSCNYNVLIKKGDTLNQYNATFNVEDLEGNPVDLTTYSGFCKIKTIYNEVVKIYSGDSIQFNNGSFVLIDEEVTINKGGYHFETVVTYDNEIITIAKGFLNVI